MSTTYGELKTRVAAVLNDPDQKTFTSTLLPEVVIDGLVEIGRVMPMQYVEDIDVVENQLAYQLGTSLFDAIEPQIEVSRVEVWDPTTDPESLIFAVQHAGAEWSSNDSGWSNWGGNLYLPTRVVRGLQGYDGTYVIRVWGYAPYQTPTADEDVVPLSQAAEQGLVKYAHVAGLELLLSSRDLFTQWQTRSGNTDMTPAGLMNRLSMARADWDKYSKRILTLRTPA